MKLHQNVGLALLTATLTALTVTACGGDTAGTADCSADTDCQSGEICHPTAKVCATTCETAADCDDSAKNCAPLAGVTGNVCQCATTALCNDGNAEGDAVCSSTHNVCLTSCANGETCPDGLTCSNGECVGTGTGGSGTACDENAEQPAACAAGEYCAAGTCQPVPAATCPNFAAAGSHNQGTTGTSGPIIYSVEQVGGTTAGPGCTNFTVRVRAYRTEGEFPTTREELAAIFHVVDPSGNELPSDQLISGPSINRTNDGKNVVFDVLPCAAGTGGEYTFGAHFDDGNAFCAPVNL